MTRWTPAQMILTTAVAVAALTCGTQETLKLCNTRDGGSYVCPENLACSVERSVCVPLFCGDGRIDPGEVCDDGNNRDGDGCSADCKSTEVCGNGIVDVAVGEECDAGPHQTATCNLDCTIARCGDGKLNLAAGEQCDDGNRRGGDGCSADCRLESCGNGIVDFGEECDLGPNNSNSGDCLVNCRIARCGDGFVDTTGLHPEECDAGPVQTVTCNLDCTITRCGDGKLNLAAGETCDDGNTINGDGCSAICRLE
jgi:cysteine-rich repeat protein